MLSRPANAAANGPAQARVGAGHTQGHGQQVQFDVPTVNVNGGRLPGQARPRQQRSANGLPSANSSSSGNGGGGAKNGQQAAEEMTGSGWGANFWVTLVEPQSNESFYACPATGQVSWDPPVGNFVLPPSPDGEWWELIDDSRGGIPYYYHTKSNETVWERPAGAFVIPLAILQNSALCKRLSARYSQVFDESQLKNLADHRQSLLSSSSTNSHSAGAAATTAMGRTSSESRVLQSSSSSAPQAPKRSTSDGPQRHLGPGHQFGQGTKLPPIPASPYHSQTEDSRSNAGSVPGAGSPPRLGQKSSREQVLAQRKEALRLQQQQERERESGREKEHNTEREKGKGKMVPGSKKGPPQSLDGAATKFAFETSPPRKSALKSSNGGNGYSGASGPPTPISPTFSTREGYAGARADADKSLGSELDVSFNPQATSSPSSKPSSAPAHSHPNANPTPSPTSSLFSPPPNLNLSLSIHTSSALPSTGLEAPSNFGGGGRGSMLQTPVTPISPGSAVTTSSVASYKTDASVVASNRAQAINRIYGTSAGPSSGASGIGTGARRSTGNLNGSAREEERVKEKMPRKSIGGPVQAASLRTQNIGNPVFDKHRTMELSPVKARLEGKPILLDIKNISTPGETNEAFNGDGTNGGGPFKSNRSRLSTGGRPVLPDELASDIQQFCQTEFARQYFMIHKTGFIFKKKIPVEKMMVWQKSPISSPLLSLNRDHHKTAVRSFKVIQRIMGDRERDRPVLLRGQASDSNLSTKSATSLMQSTTSLQNGFGGSAGAGVAGSMLEEERWLLTEGLMHGELRDELYCQVVKQLSVNPNPESVFRGWQLLCVLLVTFPPSKNFEEFLRPFIRQSTQQAEGRVDIMAKYCMQRLTIISKKGPRGKTPTAAEIETASDAAFNPSTFGESLDAIIRLQERNYPHLQVPIILPFLADGILALGGMQSEGIFRIPGDGDAVSDLKVRIERGYYNLEGVHDPHVPASLLKLWLRELCDPLVPTELYNDCVACARDADACVRMIQRLPTYHRRVVLFVISFLQLFLDEKVSSVTKMTSANLALVMAPNLLRCDSDSMTVVFTNAPYEQMFVHNLLLHLKCGKVDTGYVPKHGLGSAGASSAAQSHNRRSRKAGR